MNDSHRPPRSALLTQSTLGSSSSPGFTPGPTYAGPSSGTGSEPHAAAPGAPSGNQCPEARVPWAHGRPLQGVTPTPPNHHCRPDPSPVLSLVQYVKPHYGHLTIKSAPTLPKPNSAPIPTLSREHRSRRPHQPPQKEPCNSSSNSLLSPPVSEHHQARGPCPPAPSHPTPLFLLSHCTCAAGLCFLEPVNRLPCPCLQSLAIRRHLCVTHPKVESTDLSLRPSQSHTW